MSLAVIQPLCIPNGLSQVPEGKQWICEVHFDLFFSKAEWIAQCKDLYFTPPAVCQALNISVTFFRQRFTF